MSLTNVTLGNVVKKQYVFKLKSYIGALTALISVQLLAMFFSFNASSMSSTSREGLTVKITYYSADIVVIFTIVWAFIIASILPTKAYRNDDFTFVTNRVSSHISNILILFTLSMLGGITAISVSFLLRVIAYFFTDIQFTNINYLFHAPHHLLIGVIAASLYMFLFSALGYFAGTLVQLSRAFIFLLPILYLGPLLVGATSGRDMTAIYQFFFGESSILLFVIKVFITVALLFTCSIALSNRMEVRQV
ncbi:hypothetical protein [Bacillus sp. FJAT-52991]|uniref:ABC transporter permease n=1 Tax=Bacillus kandeliae TaxID=3129297 RepID=A0ABZ2N949_9BACI